MAKSRGGKGGKPQYPANKPATTGKKSGGGAVITRLRAVVSRRVAKVKNKPNNPYNRGRYGFIVEQIRYCGTVLVDIPDL